MRFFPYLLVVLLVASNASAECRAKECMPDSYDNRDNGTIFFYYDSIFEIGSNWFIIFEYDNG